MKLEDLTPEEIKKESENLLKLLNAMADLQEVANAWLHKEITGSYGFIADKILLFIENNIENNTELGIMVKTLVDAANKASQCDGDCENCTETHVGGVC